MTTSLQLTPYTDDDAGFMRPRGSSAEMLREADRLMQNAWHGTTLRARADLQEAMTTSDLRNAAFEILDRETLERYQALPAVWKGYARQTLVKDFKPHRIVDLLGGRQGLDHVPELTEYPERGISKAIYYLSVAKYGARFAFSWESWINDDLGELESLPEALSIAASETESRVAAALLTDGNGPNDAFFKTGYTNVFQNADGSAGSNLMSGNPPLSLAALTAAWTQITSRKDLQGRPVVFPRLVLVVPPALEVQARTVLGALTVQTQEGATGAGQKRIVAPNVIAGAFELVVEPWLTVLDTGTNAQTTWYVAPAPSSGRVAMTVGFLRGHENPQVRVKGGQGMNIGGGNIDPTEGTFEIDDIQYRCRHVLGSTYVDPIGTLASNGSGS